MQNDQHVRDNESAAAPAGKSSDPPRRQECTWLPLATVVYTWTDKRESAVDKFCWKSAGGRCQGSSVPQGPAELREMALHTPSVEHERSPDYDDRNLRIPEDSVCFAAMKHSGHSTSPV